ALALRHHLRHDAGRTGELVRDGQHPPVQSRLLVLQSRLRLVDGRGALRGRARRVDDLDQGAEDRLVVRRRGARRVASTAGFYGLAVLFMLPTVFVFYCMITLSLKHPLAATAYPRSFVRFSASLAASP